MNNDRGNMSEFAKITGALGLLSSMVSGGEKHSDTSRRAIAEALKVVDEIKSRPNDAWIMSELREQFEKETGTVAIYGDCKIIDVLEGRPTTEYVFWLEKELTRPNDAWISVEDEPKENGHYQIWDNGYGEGIFRNGEWKSTDRPIKNAMGVQCLRITLHPTHWQPLPAPPKQSSEGEER